MEETASDKTWNKLAKLYEEKFMHLDFYNHTYDFFYQSIAKQNACILDIGCGPGNISRYLHSKRPDFIIHGIDYAPNMIALAQHHIPDGIFKVMDSRNIHQLQTKYDGIIAGFCIPYLHKEEVEKLIAECNRLLTEDGILYLSFVHGHPNQSGLKTGSTGDSIYFYYHQENDIKQCLKNNEFDDVNTFAVNYEKADLTTEVHTIITARKK